MVSHQGFDIVRAICAPSYIECLPKFRCRPRQSVRVPYRMRAPEAEAVQHGFANAHKPRTGGNFSFVAKRSFNRIIISSVLSASLF